MRRRLASLSLVVIWVIVIMAASDAAWAQATNSLDRIVDLYQNNARAWEATLQTFALRLFWLLATIEFTFAAFRLAFRGADLSEWLAELVNQILFIGFFLALLTHSAEWARAIVGSFRQAAASAAQANGVAGGIAPSDIFAVGLEIAGQFVESTSLWSPGASLGLLIAALVIIVCFALIAAFLILALVESYIVISAGVLFMGFGGASWTKDIAVKTLIYAVSAGAKLFILQLIVALGAQIFRDLGRSIDTSNASLFTIIGAAIVMLALTKIVPEMVQGLINGTSIGGGGALAATATGAVTGTVSGAISGGMAVRGADRLASAQLEEAELAGRAPQTAAGRQSWLIGKGLGNLASALITNAGDRISGRAHFGSRLGQTARALHEDAASTRERAAEARLKQGPPHKPADPKNRTPSGTGDEG